MQMIRHEENGGRAARWLPPLATGIAFLLSSMLGLAVSQGSDGIAALWPANAILLSALLLCRPERRWDYVALCIPASIAANNWGGTPLGLSLLFTVANILSAIIAATTLRALRGGADAFESVAGTKRFLVAIACAVVIGATIASMGIAYSGGKFLSAWLNWASSDLLGMLLITALVLTSTRLLAAAPSVNAHDVARTVAWPLLAVCAASLVVFSQSRLPLLFVPLAALVLATYRLGLIGAVLGTMVIAIVGTVFMSADRGPISLISGTSIDRVRFFQLYLAVLFGTCLPLATLLAERARLTRERTESDRRHRRILERSREVIFETDLTGRWTYLNPAWRDLTAREPAVSLGGSFLSTIAVEDRAVALERLAVLFRGDIGECQQELRFVRADGSVRWASVRSHLLFDESDVAVGTYGTIHDVTERRTANDARTESERLYKLLADNSNDLIVKLSLEGVRRYVSPASIHVLGYTPEELLNESAAGIIHPDDRATAIATCQTLLEGVANPICVYRQLHKNGSYVWLEASYRLIRDDSGTPVEFIATVRDVGRREEAELERFKANARLQEANRLLHMAADMSMIGHWRVDLASGSVIWSDVVCAIHGRPNGYAPLLDEALEAYHPDERAEVQALVDKAIATGTDFGFSSRIVRSDGTIRNVMSRGRAEVGPDGSIVGLFGVFQDVTEAFEADAALQAASRKLGESNRLLTMAEAVGKLGHWRIEYSDQSMVWSDEVYRIYSLPHDATPAVETALALYHPDDLPMVRAALARARESTEDYVSHARILRPDGSTGHILTRGEVEYGAGGAAVGLFGIVQDITEQVEAEAQLQEREARFRLLAEQASDMISLHDVGGRCLFVSPSIASMLGYEPADVLGQMPSSLMPHEDLPLARRLQRDLVERPPGEVSSARFRMTRRDRRLVWVEAAARIADYQAEPRIIVVCRDVTEQVRVEDELQAARIQAEGSAKAKSSFLANMSHEIRTPMNGVVGFTELLLAGELSDEQRRRAEMIADSGRAMMRLLNDILDLSKVEAGQMIMSDEPFDLPHALRACMKLVTPALEKKGIEARCDLADDLPAIVCGDGLRLRQIILNLMGNAAKFTSQGSVTLRASPTADGDRVVIAVEDTGIGIAPDRQAAVFEQFVQADGGIAPRFGGTGLGLAISMQLARLMGGALRLESELGRGTTFFLTLPLKLPISAHPVRPQPAPTIDDPEIAPTTKRIRVLVAEDHDVNQLLIADMLSELGYDCEIAANGEEAITMVGAAQSTGEAYGIVLMDMQMPVVDGLEATRRIRALDIGPNTLPIIALTANAYADDVTACLAAGMQAHLAKPMNLTELGAALRRWAVTPRAAASPPGGRQFSAKIRERYWTRRLETIEMLSHMVRNGRFEDADIAEVSDMLHKLAGTAQMFGEGELGDEARSLEEGLGVWPVDDRAANVPPAFEAIKRAAAG